MSLQCYQLAVVGAGSAGLASAVHAAELGARVALIERHRVGGDRLSYRLPAAAMIQAARACRRVWPAKADRRLTDPGEIDVAAVLKRARRLRTVAAGADGAENLRALGVDVIFGEARLVAADALEVEDRRLEFRRAVIATGARTAVPRVSGLDEVDFYTPERLFELTALPPRLGVVGAGSRGCEIAQAFTVLGSEVDLFVDGDRLLSGRDPDAAALVAEAMRRDGMRLHRNSRELTLRPGGDGDGVIVSLPDGGPEIAVDKLLVATGPLPNVERLGLEAAGVHYGLSGIEVDRHLRTSNRRIFAAGGVVSPEANPRRNVAHGRAADADARTAVRNALLFRRLERRRRTVPRATYTWPEIARVGIGADEAAASPKIETLTVSLAEADRGELFGGEGFLRLHVRRRGGEVLGGTLVADRAAELIGPLAMAVGRGLRIGVFADVPLPHPTRGEIYRRAAFAWRRQAARRRSASRWIGFWLALRSRF